ncbi:MAG: GTP-binding protein [Nitrososphaerota archaeon]
MFSKNKRKVAIIGAGGRDFHLFNTLYKNSNEIEVVAFLFTQIPRQTGKNYPYELAGNNYPNGIPIIDLKDLPKLIKENKIDEAILAFSDLTYNDLMKIASWILSLGIDFKIVSHLKTMLSSNKPVISICGVRTGVGKSTVTRYIVKILKEIGLKPIVIRHPMAYGNLLKKKVIKFENIEDVLKNEYLSIEERGEFYSLVKKGAIVYAGVDYEEVLRKAEKDGDIIIWDGGNNDVSFIKSDLYITVADATRPGQEIESFPGEINVRLSDVIIINKIENANKESLENIIKNIKSVNNKAEITLAKMKVIVDNPLMIKGKSVLVIEDGPTVTHGGKKFGAAYLAAKEYKAKEIVDPRPYAIGLIKEVYKEYAHLENVLPAVGYDEQQINDFLSTIEKIPCDLVLYDIITGIGDIISKYKPAIEVEYELIDIDNKLKNIIISKFSK